MDWLSLWNELLLFNVSTWTTSFILITRFIAPDIKSGWYLLQKKFYFISIDYFFKLTFFNNFQKLLLCTISIFFVMRGFEKVLRWNLDMKCHNNKHFEVSSDYVKRVCNLRLEIRDNSDERNVSFNLSYRFMAEFFFISFSFFFA